MTRRPIGDHAPSSSARHDDHAESTAPLPAPELTEAECRRCGTYIAGLDGRYACGVCGWVNDHSEGHRRLPRADEDPDRPPKGRRRPRQLPGPPDPGPQGSSVEPEPVPVPGPGAEPARGPAAEPGTSR